MIRDDFVYLDGDGGEGTKERYIEGLTFFCDSPPGGFPFAPLPAGLDGNSVLLNETKYTITNPVEVERNVVMLQVRTVNPNFKQCILYGDALHLKRSDGELKVARQVSCKFVTILTHIECTDQSRSCWIRPLSKCYPGR